MRSPVNARSSDRIKKGRPHSAQARLQGMKARQQTASRVPTALARSEFHRSPRTSKAKLVVMPHDGQGIPVRKRNVHGGRPI
jgi:hypothetical protein